MRVSLVGLAIIASAGATLTTAQAPAGGSVGNPDAAIFPPGAKVELVAPMEHVALEGTVWMPDGYLLVSDQTSNRLYKWADGELSVFMERAGYTGDPGKLGNLGLTMHKDDAMYVAMLGPNGNTVDREGRLVSCARADRAVVRYEKDGTRTVLASSYEGKQLQNPNDIVVKSDGSIYFTALGNRPASDAPPAGIYRWKNGVVDQLAIDFPGSYPNLPNGIAFSPDEKFLYTSQPGIVYRFNVQADGTITNRQTFTDDIGADGMRVDQNGNLYLSHHGELVVVSSSGKRLAALSVGRFTNLTFGDADRKTLYLASEKGIARVRVNIAGIN